MTHPQLRTLCETLHLLAIASNFMAMHWPDVHALLATLLPSRLPLEQLVVSFVLPRRARKWMTCIELSVRVVEGTRCRPLSWWFERAKVI